MRDSVCDPAGRQLKHSFYKPAGRQLKHSFYKPAGERRKESAVIQGQPFIQIDLHGMRQEEATRVIDKALAEASPFTYQIQLIHGYHRGTNLRSMIQDWYRLDARVKRIMPGDNPGITILVLKELY